MSFYYIKFQHKELIDKVKDVSRRIHTYQWHSLEDGSILVHAPYRSSIIDERFRCGMGDPGDIVHKSGDDKLLKWYRAILEEIRRKGDRSIRKSRRRR